MKLSSRLWTLFRPLADKGLAEGVVLGLLVLMLCSNVIPGPQRLYVLIEFVTMLAFLLVCGLLPESIGEPNASSGVGEGNGPQSGDDADLGSCNGR